MDPLSATAGCKVIITQCGECTVVLAKWMGQVRSVDRRLQSFYDEVSALQLVNENLKRNLESPSMIEAARSTNDPSGHLWSQVALTMEDCKSTVFAINQTIEKTKGGRFARPLKVLVDSMTTGELARYYERIQMFNVCLQLPLHMVTIAYQLAQRDDSETTRARIEQNIFAVNETIKNLNKRVRVLKPIYTNSRRQKAESKGVSDATDDVDATIYDNMENFVDRSSKFMAQAKVTAQSRPETSPPPFYPPDHNRRNSDWRVSDAGFNQNTRHIIDAWVPRVPMELPTPDPSDRGQSPTSGIQAETIMDLDSSLDSNVEDDINYELARTFVENGQDAMESEDFVSAEENFREALDTLDAVDFVAHLVCQPADITLMLAKCCLEQEKTEEAVDLLEALSAPNEHEQRHHPDIIQTCTADYMLANIYLESKAYPKAEKHAVKSFTGRRKHLPDHDAKTIEATHLVVKIYKLMGKEARARAYSKFLDSHKRSISSASGEVSLKPISRSNTTESTSTAPMPPPPPPPSSIYTSQAPPPQTMPITPISPQSVTDAKATLVNLPLNSSQATIGRAPTTVLDDDIASTIITRVDTTRTETYPRGEPFSLPRHLLKPRFLAIKSLSREDKDKAVEMGMKLLKRYDPAPSKILIHRTDDLRRNIRKRGIDMGLASTGHGYAPIHFFCELSGHQATTEVELLIEAGVDLGAIRYKPGLNNVEPMIPLQIAIEKGHQDISRVIIEALNAQTQIGRSVVDINAVKDQDGFTPLLAACRRGQVKIVSQLLEYGAAVNGEFPYMWYGNSLLHDAASRCDVEMVKLLLEYQDGRAHRRRDIGSTTQEDKFGTTPLMYAAISNNLPNQDARKRKIKNRYECMQLLLDNGSSRRSFDHDLRVRDKKGKDLFTYVMDEQDLKLRRLVEQFDKIGRKNAPPTELE